MPQSHRLQRLFAVTTSGLSATRWLAHVLAAHPEVYVAHGKHALDSVHSGDFGKEKSQADIDSLVKGNELQNFYETRSLEDVFARYQEMKPGSRAFGCVHSYTVDTLIQSARSPQTLASIRVVNLLRHPVRYIASHHALVHSAEKHPRLYQHYVERVFPQALREFPELFLLDCADYREFLAFAASCLGVANLIRDLSYPGVKSVKMEVLTTQAGALRELCEELTGLKYAPESLERFIDQGAINRHRAATSNDARAIFAAWEPWQQDMACLMMPATVLDCLESVDYDVSMLRAPAQGMAAAEPRRGQVPCLADQLRILDPRHPLLQSLDQPGPSEIQLIDTELQGFNHVRHQGRHYALPRALATQDLAQLKPEMVRRLQLRGAFLAADSVEELWSAIARALRVSPRLIEEGYRGFNLVEQRGRLWAFSQALGPLDLVHLDVRDLEQLCERGDCVANDSIAKLKRTLDDLAEWRAAQRRADEAERRLADPEADARHKTEEAMNGADSRDPIGEVMRCNLQLVANHRKPGAKVSIILVDWGVRESFHSVRYLSKQTVPRDDYEVIWVEFYNHQPKELAQLAKQAGMLDKWLVMGYPESVHYHKHRMYNAGILLAEGDICVICDSDAIFQPTFVENIRKAFAEDPKRALHVDEVRNYSKSFYPFNHPPLAKVLGKGCVNWTGTTTTGLDNHPDMLHSANYGACMAARREDLIRIGGADEHLDYLGYICGPYDLTFRLAHFGRREHWLRHEYLYHVWHPNTSGCNIEYRGPDDGMGVSLRALRARDTGRIAPYLENPAMRRLRLGAEEPGDALLSLLVRDDDRSWHRVAAHAELSRPPQLVEENVRGFNIFLYRGVWYALPQACGALQPLKVQNQEYSQCFCAGSMADIMKVLNGLPEAVCSAPQPDLIEEGYYGFNIIQYHDLWYGLGQEEGAFEIAKVKSGAYRRCIPGGSLDAVKASIRRQRNVKRIKNMVAGVLGPVRKIASLARR